LGLEYAVGRLHFETAEEYRRYAQNIVSYEGQSGVPTAREIVFFAPRHDFDAATQLSADSLISPLAYGEGEHDGLPPVQPVAQQHGFRTHTFVGAEATKDRLRRLLMRSDGVNPALLFTASHGVGWPLDDPRQRTDTGALLCQDWPAFGTLGPEHYFSAADVVGEMRPHGTIFINFACFSGGSPQWDRFIHKPGQPPPQIASNPFIAALPQALLSHPAGGALACITHVDRAWGYSIISRGTGPQLIPFQNLIANLLVGRPVGYAMKDISERFAVLGATLSRKLEDASYGFAHPEHEIVADWIERNDAEGYIVLGDPAVTLRVNEML
jgi:hypothetical protein